MSQPPVLAFVPRRGFTVRHIGDVWQLRNTRHYGPQVLNEWPRSQRRDAFEHCYRLNGVDPDEALAVMGS
ncbi:hypothetical protein FOS14_21795 [Skermania sp. ID1734]|uniref:hypothetical protein n=1 Tax=Skermania sp. ID1734 TaxID=2597516 RepID=UPI0011804914|nr:hypothetical protein [Skermania sp. ID1734]TSD93916.1 hypothetical protein FOS14_21795 [Skermania sp. ID1734]